ncbi:hypothetical protein L596_004089 [Steinernema carpocapsae]|uniref:Transcription initiation factor TFIID subunit 12 n=1 Tax=Steinernema carpocapsae TaxID=34508 RepID=A0A4U8UUS5_STECR|nr:hypothetical protein L596_004089 [Steinernema carpocapsae]
MWFPAAFPCCSSSIFWLAVVSMQEANGGAESHCHYEVNCGIVGMADYPGQQHNVGGSEMMPVGAGNQMQQHTHSMGHQQHMMGQQMQPPQMMPMQLRGAANQSQFAHRMTGGPIMMHPRQPSAMNYRPQVMRIPMDQQRFAFVGNEHVHQMGVLHSGAPQQPGHSNFSQVSQGHQHPHQHQMVSQHQMMPQQMQKQMGSVSSKMTSGANHGLPAVTYNQNLSLNTTVIHQRQPGPGTFRQPLIRQPMDPRMVFMIPNEQMQHMERARMQNVMQQRAMAPNQPPHPSQMHQPPQSSSALRQALGCMTSSGPMSSMSTTSTPPAPTPLSSTPTPGMTVTAESVHSFGDEASGSGDVAFHREHLSTSSLSSALGNQIIHINPKLANQPVLSREALDRIVKSVDPHETLEDDVADAICVMMDEFIDDVIGEASRVARHRGGTRIEGRDVSYALEHFFDMPVSTDSFFTGSQSLANRARLVTSDAHQQRMALIRKTLKKP